jgi:hypothetical protein
MRVVLIVMLAVVLAGCMQHAPVVVTAATGPPQGPSAWNVHKGKDRISGQRAASAYVVTQRTASAKWNRRPVGLELSCFEKRPVVRVLYPTRVGANRSAILEYRVDEKPGGKAEARFLQDYKTIVIEQQAAVAKFAQELAGSKRLYLRVTSLFAGQTTAEFFVHGAADAMDTAYADCSPTPGPAQRRTA